MLRVDGGLRNGRDVLVLAAMGGDEFGFGTVAMIATGCIMARVCHTNNCPVGVASQREELRARFPGTPGDLVRQPLSFSRPSVFRAILGTLEKGTCVYILLRGNDKKSSQIGPLQRARDDAKKLARNACILDIDYSLLLPVVVVDKDF